MSEQLWKLGACELAAGIRAGTYSSHDVATQCLDRIASTNKTVNALTEVRPEATLAAAKEADDALAGGQVQGSLHGVPVVIKGNVDLAGWATVNGSKALVDNVVSESSPSVQNLLNAGAIVLGRSNTPEFCVRWDTTNDVFGATCNPWNLDLSPGGSSGGSAASLAVGMTPLALGTDLGGSLRHPAQACGVASIRPTLGRVPDYVPSENEPAIANQLMNTDGPMARSVADVRLALQVMSAGDWRDPWWVPAPLQAPEPSELPVAVITNPLGEGVDPQVRSGVDKAVNALTKAGYAMHEDEPSTLADAVDVWNNMLVGELFMGLEPAVKDFCGDALLRAIDHYHRALPDWTVEKYHQSFGERRRVFRDWMDFFRKYSVIIAPVSTIPPQLTDFDVATPESTAQSMHACRMLVAINALGLPSVVVPVGIESDLPQAVQVIGAPFQEMRCLEVAEAIEQSVGKITPIDPS